MRISYWSSDVCSSDLVHEKAGKDEGVRQQEDPHHGLPPGDALEHLPVGSPIRGERFRAMRVCCDLALGGHALRHIQSTRFRTMEPNANSAQHQQSEHRQPHDQQEVPVARSEEHTSELQSLMRNSYAVFCLK